MNIDNGPWIRHEGEEWSKEAHSPVDGAAWPKDGLGLQPQGWSSWDAGECLYSIDVDSQGKRIATAGSDAKVKVWSVLPLLSLAAEHDEAQHPRLLATISEHSAPVNTVRCVIGSYGQASHAPSRAASKACTLRPADSPAARSSWRPAQTIGWCASSSCYRDPARLFSAPRRASRIGSSCTRCAGTGERTLRGSRGPG